MAQRTHTPLHTGDESPSCGLCCRRARLKLTAPTATLDTPSPISSTESTRRLPIIWPLVHILPRSSFLPAQRGNPTIHLLSSTTPSPFLPLPDPKTFPSSPGGALSTRTGCPGPETRFLDRARGKTAAPLPGRSDRDRRRKDPWSESRRGEETGRRVFPKRSSPELPVPLARRCPEFCRVLVSAGKPAPSFASRRPGSPSLPCQGDELCFPDMQSQTARSLSLSLARPPLSSPLFSR